jgi:hypothetical protein
MEPRWRLIESLAGGTLVMQQQGEVYLPREPGELPFVDTATGITIDPYQTRLANSMVTPFVYQMESLLAGMITRKPIALEDTSDVIVEHMTDVDQASNDLNVFANQILRTMIRYGHVGVLVDFPRSEDGTPGDRPYWVVYSPRDILDARADVINGSRKMTMVRLYEKVEVAYGEWGYETVEQVRVLEVGKYSLYRKQLSRGSDFTLVEEGPMSSDEIPFAVAYANRTGWMESQPPMEEIGWLNLKHYRADSDQSNILHISAVPKQFLFGFPTEMDQMIASPHFGIAAPLDARVEFSEPTGNSYQARAAELERIEQAIMKAGVMAIMGQNMSNQSGLAKELERSQGDSALMSIALQLQDLIDTCLLHHGNYLGIPDGAHCVVNRNFLSLKLDPTEVAQVIALYNSPSPMITLETALQMLQAGQWLPEETSVEDEIEAVEQQRSMKIDAQETRLANAIARDRSPIQMQQEPIEDDGELADDV